MSLLMKALEQAAKDRGETKTEPAAAPAAGKPELSLALELLAPDTPAQTRAEPAPRSRPADSPATGEQARAATIAQAGARAAGAHGHYRRINPVMLIGAVAGLFAIGFGIYVYLQIYHPGLFVRRTAPVPVVTPVTPVPPPATPAASASVTLPASTVLQPPVTDTRDPPAAATLPPPPPKPAASPPPQQPASAPASKIVISRSTVAPTVNPTLTEAYDALQSGNMDSAQRLYAQVERAEPSNIDALLGLAAVAAAQGRTDDAARHYLRILELDPRHAVAQSGLIGVYGRGDPQGAETRLKQLIARDPSAFLFFTLGNLYADQSLWAQAQQAYFQAHHLEPGNPDYAYNLAVGLEHLGQAKLALGFYRQATTLAAARGYANFSRARAEERIKRLGAQVE
jgi:tetratricopeptide (TPR) repeat protein